MLVTLGAVGIALCEAKSVRWGLSIGSVTVGGVAMLVGCCWRRQQRAARPPQLAAPTVPQQTDDLPVNTRVQLHRLWTAVASDVKDYTVAQLMELPLTQQHSIVLGHIGHGNDWAALQRVLEESVRPGLR